ncbi:hypothetical protein IC235_17650 [Hymenobacter sp. BT664]|uniref:Uncharacterized protein n=1 Tax=Hymenobacter montanus TaxID=2771359 RepID=A0A927GKL6_9BACT|nr:hypothetical protein [Hymenobacter montanus]MBD2769718.1 hypothetical protein [Hymenobacter montanus]
MREVYTALEAKIKAILPVVRDVERHFGQLAMEAAGQGKPVNFPAVYYELVNIRTASRGRGIQDCDGILRLRLCDRALVVQQLRTVKMEEEAYFGLSGWRGASLMTGLERVAVYPDPNYRGTEVIIQEYAIKWTDTSLRDRTTTSIPGSQLTGETAVNL